MNRLSSKILIVSWLLIATFISVTHHHNDLKEHRDCLICTLSVNLLGGDVVDAFTLKKVDNYFIHIINYMNILYIFDLYNIPLSRAPPSFS